MSKQDKDFSIDKNSEQNSSDEVQQAEQNSIDDMIEYQNNQFNPGYYCRHRKNTPRH